VIVEWEYPVCVTLRNGQAQRINEPVRATIPYHNWFEFENGQTLSVARSTAQTSINFVSVRFGYMSAEQLRITRDDDRRTETLE